jgi:hypothetical protein
VLWHYFFLFLSRVSLYVAVLRDYLTDFDVLSVRTESANEATDSEDDEELVDVVHVAAGRGAAVATAGGSDGAAVADGGGAGVATPAVVRVASRDSSASMRSSNQLRPCSSLATISRSILFSCACAFK